ncbi:hypothetical protein Pcinc_032556 [Petrolisthes cinctipes]|uniref:Cation-transporting ATPase n=1 Tax=Petrolisthes cinctipes TaxID=88211 RepID=A0AAE1EUI2_PETCI|nr:hypothetical protein Pcinc_032556 [Petrolisthes cinctipes]
MSFWGEVCAEHCCIGGRESVKCQGVCTSVMWGTKATPDRLNLGTKDELEATGYQRNVVKLVLTTVATVLSAGLLLIPLTWRPSFRLPLTHTHCPLAQATTVLLKDIHGQLWEEEVVREEVEEEGKNTTRIYFMNRKIKYFWDDSTCTFVKLRPLDDSPTFNTFHQRASGLSECEAQRRKALYGENILDIAVLSIWQLLVQQAVNPFYIFQAFTVVLWSVEGYYLYSGCVALLSIVSISVMVWEIRRAINPFYMYQALCVVVWVCKGYFLTGLTIAALSLATIIFSLVQSRRQSLTLQKTVTSQSEVSVLRDGKGESGFLFP